LVGDGAGDVSVAQQTGDPQILHHNHRLGFRQCCGGFVQCVNALIADPPVAPR
jgi:hypothetical protein